MTLAEAAAFLEVSERTVRRLIKDGTITARREPDGWVIDVPSFGGEYRKNSHRRKRAPKVRVAAPIRSEIDRTYGTPYWWEGNAVMAAAMDYRATMITGVETVTTLEELPGVGQLWRIVNPEITTAAQWKEIGCVAIRYLHRLGYLNEEHRGPRQWNTKGFAPLKGLLGTRLRHCWFHGSDGAPRPAPGAETRPFRYERRNDGGSLLREAHLPLYGTEYAN